MDDKFKNIIKSNLLDIRIKGCQKEDKYVDITASYDRMEDLLHYIIGQNILIPLKISLYDEKSLYSQKDYLTIQRFLVLLNRFNIKEMRFNLSDTAFPIYSALMKSINWVHGKNTIMNLSINRDPLNKKKRNLMLLSSPGQLLLPEELLIWQSIDVLEKLNGKVDENVLKDSIIIKKYIEKFYEIIKSRYKIEQFTEFDKVMIISKFIKRYFNRTKDESDKIVVEAEQRTIDSPGEIIKSKTGSILGCSRLMAMLLNNELFRTNAFIVRGKLENNPHIWVGIVIDDFIYWCCSTYLRPFFDLNDNNCILDNAELLSKIYNFDSFNDARYKSEEKKVLSLLRNTKST